MADIKLHIGSKGEFDDEKINRILTQNTEVANTSVEIDSNGVFDVILTNDSFGINALCMAENGTEDLRLIFNEEDFLANFTGDTGLVDDDDFAFVWGVVPESKELDVGIVLEGQSLKEVVVVGDINSKQFPTEAIVNGNTFQNRNNTWVIQINPKLERNIIIFTKWNRENYNAVITKISALEHDVTIKNSNIKSFEFIRQANPNLGQIHYSLVESTGTVDFLDESNKLKNLLNSQTINFSDLSLSVSMNNKVVGVFKADINSSYSEDDVFKIELSSNMQKLKNYVVDFSKIYGSLGSYEVPTIEACKDVSAYNILVAVLTAYYRDMLINNYQLANDYIATFSFDGSYNKLLGSSFKIMGDTNSIETTLESDTTLMYFNQHKYYVSFKAKATQQNSAVEFFFPISSGSSVSGVAGLDWTNIRGFIEPRQDIETDYKNARLDNNNNYNPIDVEYKDIMIYDLTAMGLEDKSIEWCIENIDVYEKVDKFFNSRALYRTEQLDDGRKVCFESSLSHFSQCINIGFINFENKKAWDVLDNICKVLPLQIFENSEGFLVGIIGRAIHIKSDEFIIIPRKNQFDKKKYGSLLTNKYSGINLQYKRYKEEPYILDKNIKNSISATTNQLIVANLTEEQRKNFSNDSILKIVPGDNVVRRSVSLNTAGENVLWQTFEYDFSVTSEMGAGYISPNGSQYYLLSGLNEYGTKLEFRDSTLQYFNSINDFYSALENTSKYADSYIPIVGVIGDETAYNKKSKYVVGISDDLFRDYASQGIYLYVLGDYLKYVSEAIDFKSAKQENVFYYDIGEFGQDETTYKEISLPESSPTKIADVMDEYIRFDYSNGKRTLTTTVSCGDYKDSNGTIKKDWSKGEIFEIGDLVRIDKDNNGNSEFLYANSQEILWKVVGVKPRKIGCPFLTLELEESIGFDQTAKMPQDANV